MLDTSEWQALKKVMPNTMFGLIRQICVHPKYNNEKVRVNFTAARAVKECDLWYVNFGFR